MGNPYAQPLKEQLWPEGFRRDMWLILDGARDRAVYSMLLNSHFDYSCLYQGAIPAALEAAAPYLVELDFDYRYTHELLNRAWGNSWGVILRCDAGMESIRRHLRRFLTVFDPNGKQLLFRYYDPRILRAYLPTCNENELRTVFGPIDRFFVEDYDPAYVWEYHVEKSRLQQTKIALLS